MATYLHFAPAVALAAAVGTRTVGWRLMLAGALCGVLPDLDFLSVTLHLDRYSGPYGHRGFTHSLGFALLVGLIGVMWPSDGATGWQRRAGRGAFLALSTASHPLLDSLFDVGICSAWFWPLDDARHCFDWRPVPMQGIALFGEERFRLELQWIGVPLLLLANAGMLLRHGWDTVRARFRQQRQQPSTMKRSPVPDPMAGPRERRRLRAEAMQAVGQAWMGQAQWR